MKITFHISQRQCVISENGETEENEVFLIDVCEPKKETDIILENLDRSIVVELHNELYLPK